MWLIFPLLIGGLAFYAFFPGLMSPDALFQYAQGKSGQISNLHPPVMAWIWQGTDRFLEGPGGIYALYMSIYLLSVFSIARHLFGGWHKRASSVSMLLLPPLAAVLMTVWKDSLMLAMLMMAVAAILTLQRTRQWRWFVLGVGALWLAAMLRHNALPALFPLAFLLVYHAPRLKRCWWCMTAKALVLVGMMAASQPVIEQRAGITRISMLPTVAVWDMAAISIAEDRMMLPSYVLSWQGMNMLRLKALFSPISNVPLCRYVAGVGREVECMQAIPLRRASGIDAKKLPQLTRDWLALIQAHPQAYLAHRTQLFMHLLGIQKREDFIGFNVAHAQPDTLRGAWYEGQSPQALGIERFEEPSRRGQWLAFGFQLLKKQTPLLDVWPYLLVLAATSAVFVFGQRHNALRATAIGLCASGWLMLLPLFFIAPNAQLRYAIWPIACAIITALMVRSAKRKRRSAMPESYHAALRE